MYLGRGALTVHVNVFFCSISLCARLRISLSHPHLSSHQTIESDIPAALGFRLRLTKRGGRGGIRRLERKSPKYFLDTSCHGIFAFLPVLQNVGESLP